ncbi:hypothetical protein T492DRAFT_948485 [Pavlovales sp. CCMP2436]|nr:hypothetical protein T492DRAFT_948485 [Pavlovales sp. CCMP2436]
MEGMHGLSRSTLAAAAPGAEVKAKAALAAGEGAVVRVLHMGDPRPQLVPARLPRLPHAARLQANTNRCAAATQVSEIEATVVEMAGMWGAATGIPCTACLHKVPGIPVKRARDIMKRFATQSRSSTRPRSNYTMMIGVGPLEAAARIKKQLIGTIAARSHAQLLFAHLNALAPITAQRGNTTHSNQQTISLKALARAHNRRSIGTRGGALASAAD